MKLSVVATLYKSAAYVDEFCRRVCASADAVTSDYELILVNDGSPDDSLNRALALQSHNPRIVVVDLSRNFGHHQAMMTGLRAARGDVIFLLDSDLDEPPEVLAEFFTRLEADKYDVVYGFQEQRHRGWFDRVTGELFYWLFNRFSEIQIPRNVMNLRLMTRRYVDSLLKFNEREIFIAGLWSAAGYRQLGLPVDKASRNGSSYSWSKRFAQLLQVASFSSIPLAMVAAAGAAISLISLVVIIALFVLWMTENLLIGWPSLVASIWLLGGMTIFCVGAVGLYVSKVFIEVKQRPIAIIRDVYRADEPPATGQQPI